MADEVELAGSGDPGAADEAGVQEHGRLIRIALMLRELQEEVRRAEPDPAGIERLRTIHDRAIQQLCDALSGELREEFSALALPFDDDVPTGSEIRIAQAQLIGWLEGLFQGIQAAIMSQQMMARQQLADMQQRQLPAGGRAGHGGEPGPGHGQYL